MAVRNVILIVIDSLRPDHLGFYGNKWIQTPNFDLLSTESVIFTGAYPESLPTLPFRKALFTGRRTFPFRNHQYYKGDFAGSPGWGPIPEEQDTLAEILQGHGYRTGFITDTYHYFKPSENYHRGFDEWNWIRGQENDPFRSGPRSSMAEISQHLPSSLTQEAKLVWARKTFDFKDFIGKYLANVRERANEEDYFPAQVFRAGARWLERNRDADNFFLVLDSFDPHEPWDPPDHYRQLYDRGTDAVDFLASLYAEADRVDSRILSRLRANYAGEVTLVDTWFGYFIDRVRKLGLMKDTLLVVVSDHGHCIGEHGIVGKQGHPMSREIADLVLLVHHPHGDRAGTVCPGFVYNHDIAPTILAQLRITPSDAMEGRDIWPLVLGRSDDTRDHVTCGYGPFVMVRDREWWYNAYLWGESPLLFKLQDDPQLNRNVAKCHPEICERMNRWALADAGGEVPEYLRQSKGEPGCTPLIQDLS